jgi:alpha-galactosidase
VVKPLSDGAVAVSLTNVSPVPRRVTVPLATAGVAGPVEVTDAWAMRSLGRRSEVSVRLRRHASELYVCRP